MTKLFSTLLLSAVAAATFPTFAEAQTQNCPSGYVLVCTSNIRYTYDAVGNRIARGQYCYCSAATPRMAQRDTTQTTTPESETALNTDANTNNTNAPTITGLYPNPTTSAVQVKFSTVLERATIAVSNQLGETIATFPVSGTEATIDLGNYPAAIYLFTLRTGTAQQTLRVAKVE